MNTNTRLWAAAAAAAALLGAPLAALGANETVDVTAGTVIRNVNVVDTRTGELRRAMAVALDGDTIGRVARDADVRVAAGVKVVDGSGRYLIPGLLDMHTHSLGAAARTPTHWPLYVANGVTGVREMSGSAALIALGRQLNSASAAGELVAPEIVQVPGDLFAGPYTAAQARERVSAQKAQGAGFLKVIGGSPDAVRATLAEARSQGLRVAGHIPAYLRAADAAEAGWGSVEHLGSGLGLALDCSSDEAAVRQAVLGGAAPPVLSPLAIVSPMLYRATDAPFYRRVAQTFDAGRCAAVARRQAELGIWHAPTLIRLRTMEFSDDPAHTQDPNLKYVDKATRALWGELARQFAATVPQDAAEAFRTAYGTHQAVVKALHEQGVPLLAGSDVGGIWVIPGFGLHQEFRELAAAGLPPLAVLQMATLQGARYLGREATMGTVEPGKRADLVLLRADPLQDVGNLGRIDAVFLRGRHLDSAALEQMKADVAAAHEAAPPQPARAAAALGHVH